MENSIINFLILEEYLKTNKDLILIALRYQGYTSREISKILNISESKICKKLKKIKKEIKLLLE